MRTEKDFNYYTFDIANQPAPKELVWNVIVEDVNGRQMAPFNVFDHYGFVCDLLKLKKEENFDAFCEGVVHSLRYFYWSKTEWEFVATSWPPFLEREELVKINKEKEEYEKKWGHQPFRFTFNPSIGKKLDVYTQVMLNWHNFIQYLWNNKNLINKKKFDK